MMNIEKLKQIEKDLDVKSKYLSSGTWGSNNIMYIPVILLCGAIFYFLGYAYFLIRELPWQTSVIHLGISFAAILIFSFWFYLMKKQIRKKNRERLSEFPVCLGKVVMGNDEQPVYYCIYTTGEKRLDMDWLNHIYYKIWHTEEEPDIKLRKKIDSIFKPTMQALSTADSTLLPIEFTEGEKVYKKIFGFQPKEDTLVKNNNGFFPVIFFNKISVPAIQEEDYMD